MEEKQSHSQTFKEHELYQAIFIVNKHAKAAPMPKLLYKLKRQALQKLIEEGKALKLGLHYSDNPKNAQQQSDVIIQCGDYVFHLPPSKEDIKCLPHLGKRSLNIRNPKTHMSLTRAKAILNAYIGPTEEEAPKQDIRRRTAKTQNRSFERSYFSTQRKNEANVFTSSFLGKKMYK
ncbi:hypothetical protein IEO70_00790 [Bacillus sp. AGMB 02131]|uniref:YkyB-like protein n=1 Tax=Peribacillus faecalis TaxID=2772559 RepID=A0A927HB07_9BACI|nr:YkyB family protein [Peribacillus faecalis]MBD3106913.1 hypothetical protein [Peribacillus faecalis]